jgi:Domain of unknown function (DUF4440)
MKKYSLYLMATAIIACNGAADVKIINNDRNQLRNLKEELWPRAYAIQDTVLLKNILHDDFQLIDADGNVTDKRFEINWIKKNAVKHDSFFYEIKRLSIFENGTAIIAGTGHIKDGQVRTIYQSSNTLIKENGRWRAISSHVSGVKELD